MFAVVVRFRLHPARITQFLPLMHANAAASLRGEPGCRVFDVATDPDRPEDVLLYELYDDADAFAAHLAAAHFIAFSRATAGMVAEKEVRTYRELHR